VDALFSAKLLKAEALDPDSPSPSASPSSTQDAQYNNQPDPDKNRVVRVLVFGL
jgi:hypothetical protein